jgi:hypothetical protein
MGILSFLALILLSLSGYSIGASIKSGRSIELKPQMIDLIFVALIWTGAIYSRSFFGINKWLLILLWFMLGIIVGYLAVWPRKLSSRRIPTVHKKQYSSSKITKKLWNSWQEFSIKIGSYQSRVILSFFYFIFVSPFALLVKIFSDPLKIKPGKLEFTKTHWLSKKVVNLSKEQYRRHF